MTGIQRICCCTTPPLPVCDFSTSLEGCYPDLPDTLTVTHTGTINADQGVNTWVITLDITSVVSMDVDGGYCFWDATQTADTPPDPPLISGTITTSFNGGAARVYDVGTEDVTFPSPIINDRVTINCVSTDDPPTRNIPAQLNGIEQGGSAEITFGVTVEADPGIRDPRLHDPSDWSITVLTIQGTSATVTSSSLSVAVS